MKTYLLMPGVRQAIAKAGETGVAVAYNVTAWINDYPSGVPQLMVTRPNGQRVPVTVTVADNLITGQVPDELLVNPGMYSYVFAWTSGETQLTSGPCECIVLGSDLAKTWADIRKAPDWAERIFLAAGVIEGSFDGAVAIRNEIMDALHGAEDAQTAAEAAQEAAEDAQEAAEGAQAAAEAVQASIPEEYTELSDDVVGLKDTVNNRALRWTALNPSDYSNKLANIKAPLMGGVSHDDTWTDRPTGVGAGTFINFKYNATYATQMFVRYPGQSFFVRLVDVKTGTVVTDWVSVALKSDVDALANVYLHAKTIAPSSYDSLLAKVSDICVAGVQNTDAWNDKPGSEIAGTFINYPYNATYSTQMFISYPGQRFYARLTDKKNGTALTDWVKYALASEIDTLTNTINGFASSYIHMTTLTPSQYDNKLAKVSVPCLAGISNTDTWNDKPSGVTAGTFINFKYNSGYATQMIVTYPGQSVYVRLANVRNGSAATDWVKVATSSDISTIASSYIHRITAAPSSYDNVLAKISAPCIFAVGNTSGWTDKPEGVDAGTFVNFAYDGTNSTQVFISYPKEKIFVRLVSSSGSVLVGWKQLAGNYDTVWYALGDSITAGSYSNDDGEGIVATNAEWAYPNRVARSNFCTVHNLGVPGEAITEMGSQAALVGSDATLITITGGANDYYMKTLPLGSASSTKDYTTVCGALKSVIETVAAAAPRARIVLISPLIIKYGTASTKWSLNYAVQNKGNFTYAELSDAMKSIAEYYNIEFIDGTRTGPTNVLNIASVQKDGVHPTKEYYNAIANWIGSKLF